jgi:hypothetical protein
MLVTWLLRFPEKERKAVIMMASQKNLPTAAGVCLWVFGAALNQQQHMASAGRSVGGSAPAVAACWTASW